MVKQPKRRTPGKNIPPHEMRACSPYTELEIRNKCSNHTVRGKIEHIGGGQIEHMFPPQSIVNRYLG
jgi:hypothetical protein